MERYDSESRSVQHGTGFLVMLAVGLVMWSLAAAIFFYPLATQLVFTVAFLFALGMMARENYRLLWCWTAVMCGAIAIVITVFV